MKEKEKIIKTLTDFGKLPTSRIAAICGFTFNKAKILLEELIEEGKIQMFPESLATYWRILEKEND